MSISEDPGLQPILFGLFLSMYLVTVLGNGLIILAVSSDSHLHTPMYFFLSVLSLTDICFVSTTVPKLIVDVQSNSGVISFVGCLIQLSLFAFFGCMDTMLLTVMAYDRYIAICHPLHYPVIMNSHLCGFLVLICVVLSFFDSLMHDLIVMQFPYFKDVEVSNFFCDPSELLSLICSDTYSNIIVKYTLAAAYVAFSITGILFSYYKIISSILKIPSSGGRHKAFSTCGSHLSVVSLFYGTATGVYFGSSILHSPRKALLATVMYTVVTPMLNPFIYSLRNRDIKGSLGRLCKEKNVVSVLGHQG